MRLVYIYSRALNYDFAYYEMFLRPRSLRWLVMLPDNPPFICDCTTRVEYYTFPLGCSPGGLVLGPEASPKRARAPEGVCGVDLTHALN